MDSNRRFSFTNLFNLEPLINYKLPQPDADVFDYYGNNNGSSQDESRGSQGGLMGDHSNGVMSQRDSKRKRRAGYSSDEGEDRDYNNRVSEEQYRAMLGEHVQKYKRRMKTPSPSPASNKTLTPGAKSGSGVKDQKLGSEQRGHKLDSSSDYLHPSQSSKSGSFHRSGFTPKQGPNRLVTDPGYLDIGDGISYRIPLPYEKMSPSLNLPSLPDIHVEEFYLKGTLDLGSLAAMMASENRFGSRSLTGMGFTKPQYESLQSRLLTQPANDETQIFDLKVSDTALEASSVPEGSAGNIRRLILSESNILQVCYVKVREKGDTYEIIERSLPKKPKVKKDPSVIEKEEKEKMGRYWTSIARKDIPRHHRNFFNLHKKRSMEAKRFAEICQREVKMKVSRSLKLMRGAGIRTRKLARDMLLFWKRVDKEMAEVRKRQEKEAAVALKREQELREAKRQQQRLNFLLSQTELYSHFMQNKSASQPIDPSATGVPAANEMLLTSEAELDVEEDPEDAELRKEALKAAQDAVSKQKKITSAFDNEYLKLQQNADVEALHEDGSVEASVNMDLLHPSTMPVASNVKTPELFQGNLKEYQLKGLQWLVNCYEQGLNGILADEMGLGKTIQAIAFLGHLAEEKNIWGPFLVVAPSSVLSNWADEIGRFCPDLKILPYWGGPSERNVLRKHINSKHLYRRDAIFHILITSYQLLVVDEKYFRRVKWQYMVLDEAQAIKSAQSVRWKTLLSFNCRNRLLLTGTPIQNNMAELWALLHFIMPTLFDSHEQFNEWFSKGIENHAEHGGKLNEHQLTRLHAILKPFMLRRVKKDVITEMTAKTEITVHCKLSSRQKAFYQAIKNKISLAELFDGNRGHLNEKKILNLMNIVIQLRKVCNHPELFERNEGSTYFHFGEIPNSLRPPPHGTPESIYYSGCYNPITYKMPKLVYQELVRESNLQFVPGHKGIRKDIFEKYFNIFAPENICRSLFQTCHISGDLLVQSGTFGFASLSDLSPSELSFLATGTFMERLLFSIMRRDRQCLDGVLKLLMETEDVFELNQIGREKVRAVRRMLLLPSESEGTLLLRHATGPGNAPFESLVTPYEEKLLLNNKLLHSTYSYIPRVRAPPISIHCADRDFAYKMIEHLQHPWLKRFLVGFARTSDLNGPKEPNCHPLIQEIDSELPLSQPALQLTYDIFGSCPPFQPFDPAKMLTDSGKLQTLDVLLKRLRAGNHRVLLFAQMTKMLNIIEDYMNYRKYKYLRLDGSSTIPERRDMVKDFQERNDIFVFLLSTRAGGLGINLTAADTVIFYESDWNPTLDLQAMDRAHRLGQTKDVTVYRLICKETVEEKILLRASQKNVVQELVMTGGHVQGDLLAPEDVVSLLIDDPHLERKLKENPLQARERQKRKAVTKGIRVDDEGAASFQDYAELDAEANERDNLDPGEILPNNKKRKAKSEKQAPKSRSSKGAKISESSSPNSVSLSIELEHPQVKSDGAPQRPKRLKRPTKSVNENLEPAFVASSSVVQEGNQNLPMSPS